MVGSPECQNLSRMEGSGMLILPRVLRPILLLQGINLVW